MQVLATVLLFATVAMAVWSQWAVNHRPRLLAWILFLCGAAGLDWIAGKGSLSLPKAAAIVGMIILLKRFAGASSKGEVKEEHAETNKGSSGLAMAAYLSLGFITFVCLGTLARQVADPNEVLPGSYMLYLGLTLFVLALASFASLFSTHGRGSLPLMLWASSIILSSASTSPSAGVLVGSWILAIAAVVWEFLELRGRAHASPSDSITRRTHRLASLLALAAVFAWVYARPNLNHYLPNAIHSFGGLKVELERLPSPESKGQGEGTGADTEGGPDAQN